LKIQKLEKLKDAEINEAKIILANEATRFCHGEGAAKNAEATAKKTFVEGGAGGDLPVTEKKIAEIEAGIELIELFVETGLTSSKKEARRLIKGGGAKKNDEKILTVDDTTSSSDISDSNIIKLSSGKKNHAIIKAV